MCLRPGDLEAQSNAQIWSMSFNEGVLCEIHKRGSQAGKGKELSKDVASGSLSLV